jgi:hypothetical protein
MDARLIPNRRPHRATTSTSRRQRGTREGGPARSWRVGSLESVKTHNRWLMTATAFVPVERLEPWQSFGPNGQRVVRILERIERFDANDLVRLRLRLNDVNRDPIDSARVEVPMGAASPFQEVRSRVVAAAESLDPAARGRPSMGEWLPGRSAFVGVPNLGKLPGRRHRSGHGAVHGYRVRAHHAS